jgi:thiamine-monophosphate kinase
MARSELELIEWLAGRVPAMGGRLALGIGDDMAIVRTPRERILFASDMLLDGVHFDSRTQPLRDIGRKCLACALSDCAAMAVRPLASTISVALPRQMPDDDVEQLVDGWAKLAEEFNCAIAGGDTGSWDHPLAVDVAMVATAYPGIEPVRRSGARPGDAIHVTGPLGGSLLGKHLSFTPRITEARRIAQRFGKDLHAMIDISDGLSLDLYRVCRASGVGAHLREVLLESVVAEAARQAAQPDGRTAMDHLLSDGEDFELLLCVAPASGDADIARELGLYPIGLVTEKDLAIESADGRLRPLEPRGYQHR